MKGYTYILECSDKSFYTGSTNNIDVRLFQHKNGEGANYTKKKLPVKLVFLEEYECIDEAFYREKQIQGWSRAKKKAIIGNNFYELQKNSVCKNNTHFENNVNSSVLDPSTPLRDQNLLIHSIFGDTQGYFFSEDSEGEILKKIFSIPLRSGVIDVLSKYTEIESLEKIFVVSGPASFTSLRNMSVFVNTFQKFSKKKIKIFPIPTKNFFPLLYPNFSQYILSVGRRESFLFENNSYKKYKNPEILKILETNNDLKNCAGFFSPQVLEIFPENFSPPKTQEPEKFLKEILQQAQEKNFLPTEQLEIDYGALPNIG